MIESIGNNFPSYQSIKQAAAAPIPTGTETEVDPVIIEDLASDPERDPSRVISFLHRYLDEPVRTDGTSSLQRLAESNFPQLMILLNSTLSNPDWHVRGDTARFFLALTKCDIPSELKAQLVGPLTVALRDNYIFVRQQAAWALGELARSDIPAGDKERMIEPLTGALRDVYQSVYSETFRGGTVAWALGRLAESDISDAARNRMIDSVFNSLGSTDWEIRCGAAWTLVEIVRSGISEPAKNRIIDLIVQALRGTDPNARKGAAKAMAALAQSDIPANLKSRIVDPVINALQIQNPEVQTNAELALAALAESGIPNNQKTTMIDPLLALLRSGDQDLRIGAEEALAALAETNIPDTQKIRMIEPLTAVLGDVHLATTSEAYHGLSAATALTAIASSVGGRSRDRIVELVLDVLRNGSPEAQLGAALTIACLAEAGIPVIEQLIAGAGPGTGRALAMLADAEIPVQQKALLVDPLLKYLEDADPAVRLRTAHAFSLLANSPIPDPLKGTMVEPLLRALADEDQDVRIGAADALAVLAESDINRDLKVLMIEPAAGALGDVEQAMVYLTLRPRHAARILFNLSRSDIPGAEKRRINRLVSTSLESDSYDVHFGAAEAARLLGLEVNP